VQALEDIFAYTIETHGEAQASRYRDALFARLDALAEGRLPHGRPCAVLLGEGASENLFYVKQGSHFIVYQEGAGEVIVIDFIHERRELTTLIKAIKPDA
jgi:plasmid stabilization system protein ParE